MGIAQIISCSVAAAGIGWTNLIAAGQFLKRWIQEPDFKPSSPDFKDYGKKLGKRQLLILLCGAILCGGSLLFGIISKETVISKLKDMGLKDGFIQKLLEGDVSIQDLVKADASELEKLFTSGNGLDDNEKEGGKNGFGGGNNQEPSAPIIPLVLFFYLLN